MLLPGEVLPATFYHRPVAFGLTPVRWGDRGDATKLLPASSRPVPRQCCDGEYIPGGVPAQIVKDEPIKALHAACGMCRLHWRGNTIPSCASPGSFFWSNICPAPESPSGCCFNS